MTKAEIPIKFQLQRNDEFMWRNYDLSLVAEVSGSWRFPFNFEKAP